MNGIADARNSIRRVDVLGALRLALLLTNECAIKTFRKEILTTGVHHEG